MTGRKLYEKWVELSGVEADSWEDIGEDFQDSWNNLAEWLRDNRSAI
jgi:hypothetical protein